MKPLKNGVKRLLIIAVLLIVPGRFYSQDNDTKYKVYNRSKNFIE